MIHRIFTFYILLLCCIFPSLSEATHMVGGEITYRCLGNDQYEISLTVFRDCDTGVPPFDDPASIGIFDVNNTLLYDIRVAQRNDDTLDLTLFDPCLVAPPNVCIHTSTYVDTVTLPFIAGGYQVVYQRCCRNQDIVNIVNPTGTGTTYNTFITEEALLNCNSSPKFKEWPPVYICQGVPIQFDHSAIDADGDSIVYELCTPLTGATAGQSMPQPPNNPPYNSITWQTGFGMDNMLGGPDSLKIDRQTGLLTGTPDLAGVFVVGVCVKEYRNGVLLSSTRRDFQYAIGTCGRLVSSAFFAPEIQCDNSLMVQFQNNSQSLGSGYLWNFGDPFSSTSSTFANPVYIYPDTGRYTITLIADPSSVCADTLTKEIYLQYESITADFTVSTQTCSDTVSLLLEDQSSDSISQIIGQYWNLGNGQLDTGSQVIAVLDSSGTYIVELEIEARNGCRATAKDTLSFELAQLSGGRLLGLCDSSRQVQLNAGADTSLQYQWAADPTLSSTTIASPFASPTSDQTYYVTITAFNGIDTCVKEDSVRVIFTPPLAVDLGGDTTTCADSLQLFASSTSAVDFLWSTTIDFSNPISNTDSLWYTLSPNDSVVLYVQVTDVGGCTLVDSIQIIQDDQQLSLDIDWQELACSNQKTVQFTATLNNNQGGAVTQWSWTFGDGGIDSIANPQYSYASSGTFYPQLNVETLHGCTGLAEDTIEVLLPQLTTADTVGICPGGSNSIQLNPGANPSFQYQWAAHPTLSSTSVASPIATPITPTDYTVTITSINAGDTCVAVHQIHVGFSPGVQVNTSNITYCGDSATLIANSPTGVFFEWAGDNSFSTIFETGNPVKTVPLTKPFALYYVRATDKYGCTGQSSVLIEQLQTDVQVDFMYQTENCADSLGIQFNDLTADTTNASIIGWQWTVSDGQSSSNQNPRFVFRKSQSYIIELTVELANGCTGTKRDTLDLNIATLNGDTLVALCKGIDTVQLNIGGDPSLDYQWASSSSLSSTTSASPLAYPTTSPTTYSVSITGYNDFDTCFAVQEVTVVRPPELRLEVPKDSVVCASAVVVNVTAANHAVLEWSFSPTFSSVFATNINGFFVGLAAPPYTLNLYARVRDDYGCTLSDTVRFIRQDIPINPQFTLDKLTCSDTVQVAFTNQTTLPTISPLDQVSWNIGTQTISTLSPTVALTQSGLYPVSLTMTLDNGCTGTIRDTFELKVPSLRQIKDSISLCGRDSIVLNPNADSTLQYQWSAHPSLSSTTSPSPLAAPTSPTWYQVTITAIDDIDTCVFLDSIWLAPSTYQLEAMTDTFSCSGNISLQTNLDSTYQQLWALDTGFQLIFGQGSPLSINLNQAIKVYVQATDSLGCKSVDSVYIETRSSDLLVDFDILQGTCRDSLEISLLNQSSSANIQSYYWDFGNNQNSTQRAPQVTYTSTGNYTIGLRIEDSLGCAEILQKNLELQLAYPLISIDSLVLCEGDSVQLNSPLDSNLTYSWTPSQFISDTNSTNPWFSPPQSQGFVLNITGGYTFDGVRDSCFSEDSLQINVLDVPNLSLSGASVLCDSLVNLEAVSNYIASCQWSVGGTTIGNGAQLNWIQTEPSQMYYAQVVNQSCQRLDSIEVLNRSIQVTVDSNYTICQGDSLWLHSVNASNSDSLQYQWQTTNPIVGGGQVDSLYMIVQDSETIMLYVDNQFGCTDTLAIRLNLHPPMNYQIIVDSQLCKREVKIEVQANDSLSYSWSRDALGQDVFAQTSDWDSLLNYGSSKAFVQVKDRYGCARGDSVNLFVYPIALSLDSLEVICLGDELRLNASTNAPQDISTYNWTPQDIILNGLGTSSVDVMVSTDTLVYLQVENIYGCKDSAWTTIELKGQLPNLQITADKDSIYQGEQVQLQATDNSNYTYSWNIDPTLDVYTTSNPNAKPIQTTTYVLLVEDNQGCFRTDSIQVVVKDNYCAEPQIFIPNAFTPDGDGLNDELFVRSLVAEEVFLVIYNRWGEPIFETRDQNRPWDGTYKGKALAPDVYGYYLEVRCIGGNIFRKKGNITLIR